MLRTRTFLWWRDVDGCMRGRVRPPEPPGGLPVVGHTLSFLRDPLGCLERWGWRDVDVVRVRIAGRSICLVTSPAGVRQVLLADAEAYRKASVVRDRLGTLQGGSLVLLEGEAWRERREVLQSVFARERVAAVGSLTTRRATATVEAWPDAVTRWRRRPARASSRLTPVRVISVGCHPSGE